MDGPGRSRPTASPHAHHRFRMTAIDKAGTADSDKAEATGSPLTLTCRSLRRRKAQRPADRSDGGRFLAMTRAGCRPCTPGHLLACCGLCGIAPAAWAQPSSSAPAAIREALSAWGRPLSTRATPPVSCDCSRAIWSTTIAGFPSAVMTHGATSASVPQGPDGAFRLLPRIKEMTSRRPYRGRASGVDPQG